MAHAQKPDFVFRRNGRVHLNRRGRQFSRLLAADVCASAVVMLDTPCFDVVWRELTTQSIRQFPLYFPSPRPASLCAITFQLESNTNRPTVCARLRREMLWPICCYYFNFTFTFGMGGWGVKMFLLLGYVCLCDWLPAENSEGTNQFSRDLGLILGD